MLWVEKNDTDIRRVDQRAVDGLSDSNTGDWFWEWPVSTSLDNLWVGRQVKGQPKAYIIDEPSNRSSKEGLWDKGLSALGMSRKAAVADVPLWQEEVSRLRKSLRYAEHDRILLKPYPLSWSKLLRELIVIQSLFEHFSLILRTAQVWLMGRQISGLLREPFILYSRMTTLAFHWDETVT